MCISFKINHGVENSNIYNVCLSASTFNNPPYARVRLGQRIYRYFIICKKKILLKYYIIDFTFCPSLPYYKMYIDKVYVYLTIV